MKRRFRKRIALTVIRLLCAVVYPLVVLFLGSRTKNGLRILVYHSVHSGDDIKDEWSIPSSLFAVHMRYLSEHGYRVIDVEAAIAALKERKPLPEKAVCITFDDGFSNHFTNAYPELVKNGFTATFYVGTSYMDQTRPFPWLMPIEDYLPLRWEDISRMAGGGMFFGSHTHTHVDLSEVDESTLQHELDEAMKMLKERLPAVSNTFVCPYGIAGKARDTLKKHLKLRNYEAAFLGRFGTVRSAGDFFDLPRLTIYGDDSLFLFRQKLMGVYDWTGPLHSFLRYLRNK